MNLVLSSAFTAHLISSQQTTRALHKDSSLFERFVEVIEL